MKDRQRGASLLRLASEVWLVAAVVPTVNGDGRDKIGGRPYAFSEI